MIPTSFFPHEDGFTVGLTVGLTVGFTVGLAEGLTVGFTVDPHEPQSSGQLLQLSYAAHTPSPQDGGVALGQDTFAHRLSGELIWLPS